MENNIYQNFQRAKWTQNETELLLQFANYNDIETIDFNEILKELDNKTEQDCRSWYSFLVQTFEDWADAEDNNNTSGKPKRKKRLRRKAISIERVFKCYAEGCDRSYGSEGSLRHHFKTKHADIKYERVQPEDPSNRIDEPKNDFATVPMPQRLGDLGGIHRRPSTLSQSQDIHLSNDSSISPEVYMLQQQHARRNQSLLNSNKNSPPPPQPQSSGQSNNTEQTTTTTTSQQPGSNNYMDHSVPPNSSLGSITSLSNSYPPQTNHHWSGAQTSSTQGSPPHQNNTGAGIGGRTSSYSLPPFAMFSGPRPNQTTQQPQPNSSGGGSPSHTNSWPGPSTNPSHQLPHTIPQQQPPQHPTHQPQQQIHPSYYTALGMQPTSLPINLQRRNSIPTLGLHGGNPSSVTPPVQEDHHHHHSAANFTTINPAGAYSHTHYLPLASQMQPFQTLPLHNNDGVQQQSRNNLGGSGNIKQSSSSNSGDGMLPKSKKRKKNSDDEEVDSDSSYDDSQERRKNNKRNR